METKDQKYSTIYPRHYLHLIVEILDRDSYSLWDVFQALIGWETKRTTKKVVTTGNKLIINGSDGSEEKIGEEDINCIVETCWLLIYKKKSRMCVMVVKHQHLMHLGRYQSYWYVMGVKHYIVDDFMEDINLKRSAASRMKEFWIQIVLSS